MQKVSEPLLQAGVQREDPGGDEILRHAPHKAGKDRSAVPLLLVRATHLNHNNPDPFLELQTREGVRDGVRQIGRRRPRGRHHAGRLFPNTKSISQSRCSFPAPVTPFSFCPGQPRRLIAEKRNAL